MYEIKSFMIKLTLNWDEGVLQSSWSLRVHFARMCGEGNYSARSEDTRWRSLTSFCT